LKTKYFSRIRFVEKLVHATGVQYLGGHRLWLRFEDGAAGELDFSDEEWRGVFAPLADPDYFRRVELDEELGTIVWPNGADIAPETLYRLVTEQAEAAPR
jgi:hypothetical protein